MFPTDVRAVALSAYNGAVIDHSGVLWVAGCEAWGVSPAREWTEILRGVTQVALAASTGAALDAQGVVWVWGDNLAETLMAGGGTVLAPTALDGQYRSVVGGGDSTVAVVGDGGVWLVGDGGGARQGGVRLKQVWEGQVRAVAAGRDHLAVIDPAGTLWTRGSNKYRQCGEGAAYLPTWRRQRGNHDDVLAGDNSTWTHTGGVWRNLAEPHVSVERLIAAADVYAVAAGAGGLWADAGGRWTMLWHGNDLKAAACAGNILAAVDGTLAVAGQNTYSQLGVDGEVWPAFKFPSDPRVNATIARLRAGNTCLDMDCARLAAAAIVR